MTLLRSYDDDVAILALEAIKALAILPFTHRTLNFNHHVTALHKTSSHCAPLFQIVEAANWSFPLVAKEFLSPDFQVTDKHLLLEFDISQKPKVRIGLHAYLTSMSRNVYLTCNIKQVYGSDNSSLMDSSISESVFTIQNIDADARSIKDILADAWLPHKYLFSLMWRIRMQRLLLTRPGRVLVLTAQYLSVLSLLCCHPSSNILSHFFQDKADLLCDFVYMMRTGRHLLHCYFSI